MPSINHKLWMPEQAFDVFFFDCDGTLALIEGIDLLATMNSVAKQVRRITKRCMSTTGLSLADYRARLDFVKPTQDQIQQLADSYKANIAPGAKETIQLLHSLGKKIYLLSGGIKSALIPFAEELGINSARVLAVDLYFDSSGAYKGFDEQSELVLADGKSRQIAKILKGKERALLLGDGYSDWEARLAVSRFVGYAGLEPKDWVKTHSNFYINQTSMLPIIALGLTENEQINLDAKYRPYYQQALVDIQNGLVLIREEYS